jgi:hypothetical protein
MLTVQWTGRRPSQGYFPDRSSQYKKLQVLSIYKLLKIWTACLDAYQ